MIYLDTCVVVYWVEDHSRFAPKIAAHIAREQDSLFATSPLVMAEALVIPYRKDDAAFTRPYEDFFRQTIVLPMPEAVFIQAAKLRALHTSLKNGGCIARGHGTIPRLSVVLDKR